MAYGITGIVVLAGNDQILATRDRAEVNANFIPRIITASPILDGPDTGNPLHLKVSGSENIIQMINGYAQEGYDFIKIYNGLDEETRNAAINRSVELGLPVVGHLPPGMPFSKSIVAGFSNVAHAEEITRMWDGEDQSYLDEAVDLMAAHSVSFTPNLVCLSRKSQKKLPISTIISPARIGR